MEDNMTLATEMLKEIKTTSKRWFIAFIITLCLWFATIAGFIIYEYYSLPVEEETTTIEQESDNDSRNLVIGGDYNGETESDAQEEKER